jgi:hypothetical protein
MKRKIIVIISVIVILLVILLTFYLLTNKSSFIINNETGLKDCLVSLSFSVSVTDNCDIKANIIFSNCTDSIYEIKEESEKCSGSIKSDKETVLCDWQTVIGNYTYNLYVNNELKESRSISCLKSVPPKCNLSST